MLAAAGGTAWLAQLGPHTGYGAGVLGPMILAGAGVGMVIAPAINTGTFGVAPQDAGVASATVTVGQQLGASVGTSLLNTIFAAAVTSYLAAHLAAARLIGRLALTGLALAHGYYTAFWWTAGISPSARSPAAPCSAPGHCARRAHRPPRTPKWRLHKPRRAPLSRVMPRGRSGPARIRDRRSPAWGALGVNTSEVRRRLDAVTPDS